MPKKQRTYSREFKLKAVQLVQSSGKRRTQVAHELGIADSTLNHWCQQLAKQGDQAFTGRGYQTEVEEENLRLRQEVEESKIKQEAPKENNALVSAIPTTNVSSTANNNSDIIVTPLGENREISRFSFLTDKKRIKRILYHSLLRFAKWWMHLFSLIVTAIFLGIVGITVGINTFAPPPLVHIVNLYPTGSIVIAAGFVVVTLIALFFSVRSKQKKEAEEPILKFDWPTVVTIATPIVSVIFLLVILIQPPWCPAKLCPAPKLVTNPQGVHDSNLEVYFTTIQSVSFAIPGNPAQYTLNNLPKSTGAVLLGRQESHTLYKVVLGVHSVQQGRFGLFIEQVAIVIKQVPVIPSPLNIWTVGDVLEYNSNPYEVLYLGQGAGDTLPASNVKPPYAHQQLAPGESDELDLQIVSVRAVDLRFSVQITYRVTDEHQSYTLTLPKIFEVIFSNASNWHPFSLQQDGHF